MTTRPSKIITFEDAVPLGPNCHPCCFRLRGTGRGGRGRGCGVITRGGEHAIVSSDSNPRDAIISLHFISEFVLDDPGTWYRDGLTAVRVRPLYLSL